jgi:two-component sensor histidine kinase
MFYWARSNPFSSIVYPLLAWIVAWAAVWVVTERVVIRWLAYLDRIASIYAKGRFSVRPVQAENAPAEIRALAQTLDTMAEGIVARDMSLRDSLAQKDAMMREIHHRVKNNLQVITSLLNMQQRALKDPAARIAMSDTRQRITALALIYRALYQSPDLRRVDVRQFLEELIAQLTSGEGGRPSQIRTELHADELEIDPDKLAPLALFAVEAITNARKHAFGPEGGLIKVRFQVGVDEIMLEIIDDGEGELELPATAGVGRTLMSAFARQLRGRAEIEPAPGKGVAARLIFPKPEPMAPIIGPGHSSFALSGNQAAA